MLTAIMILAIVIILILVPIFALLIVNIKKKNSNIDSVLKDYDKIQSQNIIVLSNSYKLANKEMLDDISRQNTAVSTSLNSLINENNKALAMTIENFRDTIDKKFKSLETELVDKLQAMDKEISTNLSEQKLSSEKYNNSLKETFANSLKDIEKEINCKLKELKEDQAKDNNDIKEMLRQRLEDVDSKISRQLRDLREENQNKLDEMRGVVEDKMQKTLNDRITESFKVINEQLLAVHKGLNEMSSLTNGVNNLNKIMGNIKTRGMWGEVSLNNLLEQILTKEQFAEQVQIRGRDAVDFAVILPAKGDGENIYLPIDAKFPLSDYEKLVEASESYNKESIEDAKKNLLKRIKEEAKSISSKYIDVPRTTNFAIMYLPIEGLYAEVIKENGLIDELQNKFKIIVSGPTTITALLNSLQLGFKTLQIQKNSSEVWKALSKFRTEFQRFSKVLESAEKQANTVVKTIEDTNKKTKTIEKTLNKLDMIDYDPMELDFIGGVNENTDNKE